MTNQDHRLYRSQTNKMLAGVCGGLAEYLNVDVTIVRLVWILLTLVGGSGIILYILAIFIIPQKALVNDDPVSVPIKKSTNAGRIFGFIILAVGIILLLDNLDIFSFCRFWDISWEFVLPAILIITGIYLLVRQKKTELANPQTGVEAGENVEGDHPSSSSAPPTSNAVNRKVFRRSSTDKKIFGICGGAGEFFDIDPTIIRIAYVIFTVLTSGFGVIVYLAMYLIVPEGTPQSSKQ